MKQRNGENECMIFMIKLLTLCFKKKVQCCTGWMSRLRASVVKYVQVYMCECVCMYVQRKYGWMYFNSMIHR